MLLALVRRLDSRLGGSRLTGSERQLSLQTKPRRTPAYDRRVANARRYLLMDLFAGCGGMTRGFVDSERFEPIFAVEMDESAAATYAANFVPEGAVIEEHVVADRIENITSFPQADVVIGGPPCQGFSPLNRAGVGFERRALWREYLRALRESAAKAFVMENVPELLRSAEYEAFKKAAEEELGYQVEGRVLNAADYGVPQRRRRAIVIGVRRGEIPWPTQTHHDPSTEIPEDGEPWRTFADAVKGLSRKPNGRNWHNGRNPRPESIVRYQHVPHDGGNRFQMQDNLDAKDLGHLVPRCWRDKPKGTTDVFGRLYWKRPAFTIRTEFYKPEKGRYLHPSEDRPITIREAARCMSIPDDFELPLEQKWTEIAKQIGNAVPPLLAQRIAEALAVALDAAVDTKASRAA
jgi:DNA (cytosine-5)-methyltransferase 1